MPLTTTLNCHSAPESVSTLCKHASAPLFPLGPLHDTVLLLPSEPYWHSFKAKFKSPLLSEFFLEHTSLHGPLHPLSSNRVYFYHSFGTEMSHIIFYRNISYVSGAMLCLVAQLSHVQLFATPWSVTLQAPLFMGNSPSKNTGVGCHVLLQGIFLTQGLNPDLPHCGGILYIWVTREAHVWGTAIKIPWKHMICKILNKYMLLLWCVHLIGGDGSLVTKSCPSLVTTWTVALQAPLSMEFSRQEYCSGLPFPSPGDIPTQGLNPGLPHCRQILYQLSYEGSLCEKLRAWTVKQWGNPVT